MMFDTYGPRGAEDEREEIWTDLSEVTDDNYDEEVLPPLMPEPYGPALTPEVLPEEE